MVQEYLREHMGSEMEEQCEEQEIEGEEYKMLDM